MDDRRRSRVAIPDQNGGRTITVLLPCLGTAMPAPAVVGMIAGHRRIRVLLVEVLASVIDDQFRRIDRA
jgi:hypothetical protein